MATFDCHITISEVQCLNLNVNTHLYPAYLLDGSKHAANTIKPTRRPQTEALSLARCGEQEYDSREME